MATDTTGDDFKKLVAETKDALSTLQQQVDLGNKKAEDTMKNAEAQLHKFQDSIEEIQKKHALAEKAEAEHKEKVEELEKAVAEAKKGSDEYERRVKDLEMTLAKKQGGRDADPELARQAPEYKNFFGWLAFHPSKKESIEIDLKTLRTDSDTQGAYLIPQIMDQEIRKNITEISPVRLYARNRVSPGKTMDIPRRLAVLVAAFEGEAEQDEQRESTYGSEQVTLYRQSVTVPATLDMMVSAAFDLEREISADVGEAFGKNEGTNFISGTGTKGPQGIISDARIEVVDTGTSGEVDFLDMANLAGKLKRGQRPMWFFNRRTLAKMWQVKSSIGVPIWQPVAGDVPATIWGFPYDSNMIDMDDAQTGAGAKPVIFGDMRRGYEVFDMMGVSVIRDDLTRKREAITEWTFRRYLTGRVIIPESFKIMRVKA